MTDIPQTQSVDYTHSIYALVRLLKSPNDPPSSGPFKIEIASQAWSDPSFRATSKGEVIGEWTLTQLGQAGKSRNEKDATSGLDPISDPRYWTLLAGVLTTSPPTAARPVKTWLLPHLNRCPLDLIVIELIGLRSPQVLVPARTALIVLWPLADRKMTADTLEACLGAVFNVCVEWESVDEDLAWICSTVIGSYRYALSNAGNKKKMYNTLLTNHLSSWLRAVCNSLRVNPSHAKQLKDSLYVAGIDTFFSPDALKQPLDTLFDAMSSSPSLTPSVLPVLPKLLTSFLSATHKHRSTLFTASKNALGGKEELRKRGMDFVRRCWSLIWGPITDSPRKIEVEKLKSVVSILEVVEKERLFIARSTIGSNQGATRDDQDGEMTLRDAREVAVDVLETIHTSGADNRAELAALSTQVLDVLVRIEYDLVGGILERILAALINIPSSLLHLTKEPTSALLSHILEYHTKTRTVHTYALVLLGAAAARSSSLAAPTSSSPLIGTFPLAFHLAALARALRTYLTPTQTLTLGPAVLHAVESALQVYKDVHENSERTTKRRKVDEAMDVMNQEEISALALVRAFSYTGRIAGTVLSNLPAIAYLEDGEFSLGPVWVDVGKLGWAVVWSCLREEGGKGGETPILQGKEGKKRKHANEIGTLHSTLPHNRASVALKLLYDVRARMSAPLADCDHLEEVDVETLVHVARDKSTEPELVVDIARTLFWHIWYTHGCEPQRDAQYQSILTTVLDILAGHFSASSRWDGLSASVTRDNLGLALLYVSMERWINILDALGSTENLKKLISLLLTIPVDLPGEIGSKDDGDSQFPRDNPTITARSVLLGVLRNAQFWELHNIRAVFLSSLLTLTASLSSYPFLLSGSEVSPPIDHASQVELARAVDIYRIIHYVPVDYLTRSVRIELVKRGIAADACVCAVLRSTSEQGSTGGKNENDTSKSKSRKKPHPGSSDDSTPAKELERWTHRLTFVRIFSQRMSTSNPTTSWAFTEHLLHHSPLLPSPSEALNSVTLDLIQSHLVAFLHSRDSEAATSVSHVIGTLVAARPFSQPDSQETWPHILVQSSILKLVDYLRANFPSVSMPDEVVQAFRTLHDALVSALVPLANNLLERNIIAVEDFPSAGRVNSWSCLLILSHWLGIDSQAVKIPLGPKLVAAMLRRDGPTGMDPELHSAVFALLFEELWCTPDISHHVYLDLLVIFYAVNDGDLGSEAERLLDAHVAQALKKLSVGDFSRLLDVLVETIEGGGVRGGQRERLVHFATVLLHDAPQGTLKVVQNFATRCFNLFTGREEFYRGSSYLKMHYLEFMAKHCSDRPAAIRSIDLGSIWSLLNKILSGSSEHDATTSFVVFHHIITIIGALIRLRRDLVVHTLPHLGLVLRQLMMLTRRIRPQLGAKQSRIVTDIFPSWISSSQPLSIDEGRALARLLTSLTTKTVPRTHTHASTETQKAESLAKPFSKHAQYVLVAYIDAFNDQLCIMSTEMRRELEPGLFALCEIVGEHSRDALMVSTLDSGGKTIMKALWKEYEKQRYVGKG